LVVLRGVAGIAVVGGAVVFPIGFSDMEKWRSSKRETGPAVACLYACSGHGRCAVKKEAAECIGFPWKKFAFY
jgi:hypothetical protein